MGQKTNILEIFKSGIYEFVEISVKQHHDKLLAQLPDVEQSGFTTLASCFECNKYNLKPRHSNNVCPSPISCLCKYKQRDKRACPNYICDFICEGIIEDHMKYSPNFKTTDISQWTQNYWDIAKCYMEHSSDSAETTDILDLLHLITNNRFLLQKILQNTTDLSSEQLQKQLDKIIKKGRRIKHPATSFTPDDLKHMHLILSQLGGQNALRAKAKLEEISPEIVKSKELEKSCNKKKLQGFTYKYFKTAENAFVCSAQKSTKADNFDSRSFDLSFEQTLLIGDSVKSFEECEISESSVVDLIYGTKRYRSIFVEDTETNQKTSNKWSNKEWLIYNILNIYFKRSCKDGDVRSGSPPFPQKEKYTGLILVSEAVSKRENIPFETFKTIVKDILEESERCLVILDCSYESDCRKHFKKHTVIQVLESIKFRDQTCGKRPLTLYVKPNQVNKLTLKHEGIENVLQKRTARIIQNMLCKSVKKVGQKSISLTFERIAFEDISTKVKLTSVSEIPLLQLHECVFTPETGNSVRSIAVTSNNTNISHHLDQIKEIAYPLLRNNTNTVRFISSEIIAGEKSFCISLSSAKMDSLARDFFGKPLQNCSKAIIHSVLTFEMAKILMLSRCDINDYNLAVEDDQSLILSSIKYGLLMSNSNYVHVYPAECHLERQYSKDVVFVCFMKDNFDIDKERAFGKYRGFRTFQRSCNDVSSESSTAESSYETDYSMDEEQKKCIEETVTSNADKLMEEHSNLEMISVSMGRIKDDKIYVNDEPHIILYVRLKSFIPKGETIFPTKLKHPHKSIEFPVDIREGYFIALSDTVPVAGYQSLPTVKLSNLVMGCSIGIKGNRGSGTVGPFVQIEYENDDSKNTDTGFLTACHVFGGPSRVQDILGTLVVQPSDGDELFVNVSAQRKECDLTDDKVCGQVVACAYTSEVDVALVKITRRHPLKGAFISCLYGDYLDAELKKELKYKDGSISDPNAASNKKILKVGKRTLLTSGKCSIQADVVKIYDIDNLIITDPHTEITEKVVMKNMFHFGRSGIADVCGAGDSGAGVFLVDENEKLSCIGMAIGRMGRKCVVTPIKTILENLSTTLHKIPEYENLKVTMKKFDE